MDKFFAFFAHPFILLIIGAGISSLLVPWITRKWQLIQKALELKTEIITGIIDCIVTILENGGNLHKAKKESKDPDEISSLENNLKKKRKDWVRKSCIVGSKLHAYFPDKEFHKELDELREKCITFCFENYENRQTEEREKEGLYVIKEELINKILKEDITVLNTNRIFTKRIKKVSKEQ